MRKADTAPTVEMDESRNRRWPPRDGHDTHSYMRMVQASDAARLSGLTPHQLREWCGRRGVVTPDVPPAGRGRLALFSWQTILALRVLNEVHQRYGIEVSAWRPAIAQLQVLLIGRSFPALWGAFAVFPNSQEAMLRLQGEASPERSCLAASLDGHLEVLATPGDLGVEAQLSLFPALVIRR